MMLPYINIKVIKKLSIPIRRKMSTQWRKSFSLPCVLYRSWCPNWKPCSQKALLSVKTVESRFWENLSQVEISVKYLRFNMCTCVLPAYLFLYYMSTMLSEARSGTQIQWVWGYRQLLALIHVLWINHRSSKSINAPNN